MNYNTVYVGMDVHKDMTPAFQSLSLHCNFFNRTLSLPLLLHKYQADSAHPID